MCWHTWWSGTGRCRVNSLSEWQATEHLSTEPTPRWPPNWRRRSPAELIDEYVALIHRPRGVGRVFPRRLLLGDHVIHELDIVLALGRQPAIALPTLVAVLNTQVRVPNPFVPAAKRARGLTLHATDAAWTHGAGTRTVRGAAAHLASALAGRPWALDRLSGSGVDELSDRVSAG